MSKNNVNGIIGADVATTTGIVGATIAIGQYIVNDYVITIAEAEGDYGYTMTITRGTDTQTVTLYGLTPEQYASMLGYLEQAQAAAQSAAGSASDAADYMGAAAEMASNATTAASRASSRADAAASYASQAQQSANSAASAKTDAQTARTQAQGYRQAAEAAATRAETAAEEITGMTAEAETLEPGSPATASFLDGVLSLGIPAGANGADGNGIVSIEKTSTSGNVDTYTITYTNGSSSTFTVTNGVGGAVQSVAGKTGAVTLDAGDVSYDDQQAYYDGTVGAGLTNLKSALDYMAEIIRQPLLYSESIYRYDELSNTTFVSKRIIEQGTIINKIKSYATTNSTGFILIIDKETSVVLQKISVAVISGWNEIAINYTVPSDCYFAFANLKCKSVIPSASDTDYLFSTDATYIVSPYNPAVGSTVSIVKNSDYKAAISVQLELIVGGLISNVYDSINEVKAKAERCEEIRYDLDNGNLLKYAIIEQPIGYIGRWFDYNGNYCTNNAGAEFYFKTPKQATIVTITFGEINQQQVTPYYAISIDGGEFVRKQINDGTINLPSQGEHIIRCVIDSMTPQQAGNKWNETLGVYVVSVTTDGGDTIGIVPVNRVGMFFGDSITEGLRALGATAVDASVSSAIASFAFSCCKHLNSVMCCVGYGGTGITRESSFKPCIDAVNYLYSGMETSDYCPDFIVINHGENDAASSVSASDYINGYSEVIERLRIKYGSTPIFCVVAFRNQPYSNEIEQMCLNYKNTYYISSADWNGATTDGIHLSAAGGENNGKLLANRISDVLGKSYFIA